MGEVSRTDARQLFEVARDRAPRVREARSRLQRAKARMKGAKILNRHNPQIKAGAERFTVDDFRFGESKVGIFQRFPIAGDRAARVRAAKAFKVRLESRLEEVRWEVHVDVHRLYNRARIDLRRLEMLWLDRRFARTLAEVARRKFAAGQIPEAAKLLAEGESARAREEFLRAREQLRSRLRRLVEVSGWKGDALPLPEGELPEPTVSTGRQSLLETARSSYPPIERQKAKVEAARAELELEKRRAWPDPGIGLFAKVKDPQAGENAVGLVGQLSLPIPVWNQNTGARAAASAAVDVRKTKLQTIRQRLTTRVRRAAEQFRSADRRVEVFEERVVPAFERELKLLRKGYEAGQFDIDEVAVSQRQLLSNRRRSLKARRAYVEAGAKLEQLIGREFWSEPSLRDSGGSR
ncbi:MAG: TolC family protein [Bradymonadaceae bacterium]